MTAHANSPALQLKEVSAAYGQAQILFDVSLDVPTGSVVALMGRYGACKSTTLKSIMGLLSSVKGAVTLRGEKIDGMASFEIARRGLGYVPEDRRIFTNLTVFENLDVGLQPPRPNTPHWTPEKLFEIFPNLAEMRNRPASAMSGGEQQMLTIARTLMGNPSVILLDEPSEGIAPVIVEQMARTIKALKAEGLTVLVSEQNLYFATEVSDRAYVIEKGRIRFSGTMTELAENEEIRKAYLTL